VRSPMATEPKDTWEVAYEGETAPRYRVVAALLTLLHPTVGYLYVGRTRAAIGAAIVFTLYLAAFLLLCATTTIFPLLPLLAFTFGWALLSAMCLVGIWTDARQAGPDYVLKGYNHPVIYTLVALGVAAVPMYVASHLSTDVIYATVEVADDSMVPTIDAGDLVLVDRLAYVGHEPQRGDLVVVRGADRDGRASAGIVGRVIARAGDEVQLDGDTIRVNEEPLQRMLFAANGIPGDTSPKYIETNDGNRYLIAGDATLPPQPLDVATVTVTEGSVLILGDNRGRPTSRRHLGAIALDRVIGQPRYVLYTPEPVDGASPWARSGYRLR